MPARTLTVYGATGYTGRLVAAEAARAGLRPRLAGRRRDTLEALAAELGGGLDVAVADAGDRAALESLAATSDVLASLAGPYGELGRPVVEAALAAGCHYLDVAGEPDFLSWVHAQRDRAAASGSILCPGLGFQGAAGDLLARLAADSLGAAVHDVRVGYLVRGGRVSAGTARAVIGVAAGGGRALAGGEVVDEPLLSEAWTIPFPDPLGGVAAASFPAPEVLTLGRTVGARSARAYFALPGGAGPAAQLAAPVARLAGLAASPVAGSPAGAVLRALTGLLGEGPSALARERTRCAVLVEVSGPSGTRRAWLRLRDLYGTSARSAAGVAARLLDEPAGGGAVRTPAEAAGPDVGAFLTAAGARWDHLPPPGA